MLLLREQVRVMRVQEFLREIVVGVAALSDLAGSILVEILYSVDGGDVEQVCSNLETNLPYLRLLISLSLSLTCVLYLYAYCFIYNMLDILVLYCYIAWDYLLTLVFNQESHGCTSTLNLEES